MKLKDLITEALEWKDVPEEEKQKAYDLINNHNNNPDIDPLIKGYYAIDVTGKYQVYYTFWRYKDIDPQFAAFIKNPIYMGNLTTELISSVEKALTKAPKTIKIQLWNDATKQSLIGKTKDTLTFTFGKYRGKPFYEVFQEDPGYFAFLAKNADPKYSHTKMSKAIAFFSSLYYEEVTKQNQQTSKSQFVGNIKDKFEGELTIYKIDVKMGTDFATGRPKTYKVYKLTDDKENKFIAIDLDRHFPDAKINDKIRLRGKIKGQKEILGIKFNLLNYVKPF